jgi:hypothetical protein
LRARTGWTPAGLGSALLAVLFLSSPALASTSMGLALFAGYNEYAMSDVNQEIVLPINQYLFGTGYTIEEITGGWGVGAGLRVRPAERLLIALDYERLTAGSDLTIFAQRLDLDTSANSFAATLTYYFPSSSRARFGLGAGAGYYISAGSVGIDTSGVKSTTDLHGNGVGFHGVLALDAGISPNVHFEGIAGYRYAKTTDVEIEGETLYTGSGEKARLDWSGVMSRVGLTFYFGSH